MRLMPFAVAAALVVTACGPHPTEVSSDGEAVRKRAEDAQTARRRTGAEIQQRTLNRVVRTVYLCNNGERLSVDFDNAREMATVRNSSGEAVDLRDGGDSFGGYDVRRALAAQLAAFSAEPPPSPSRQGETP